MDAGQQSNFSRVVDDLKRRKVFRVAAAYGIGAWIVVESSSVVIPALFLPDELITVVVVIALLGFPLSLVMSYFFDITASGVVRTAAASDDHAQTVSKLSRRSIDFVVIGILLAVIAYFWVAPRFGGMRNENLRSIAVLPFVDLSQSRDSGYFGDGIAEELLNTLAGVDGLRVAARTSSFAFKDKQTNIQDIGEELNVRTILEGSVRQEGDKIRITAQLINVDNGFHMWSHTYERDFNDVFEIQDDIANQIVNALRPKLFGTGDEERVTVASSSDINAWDLYIEGRHKWNQRTESSLRLALELFRQATEIDSDYAQAYTGIADSYLLLNNYGYMDLDEAVRNAEPAIARALSLDPELGEAYASQGLLLMQKSEYDMAELALRKATELNPSLSMAHMWLGLALAQSEGLQASYEEYQNAFVIDQLHPVINHNLAFALANMGRYDEAARRMDAILRFNPRRIETLIQYANIAARHGRIERAAEVARQALAIAPDSSEALLVMAQVKSLVGDFEAASGLIDAAKRAGAEGGELAGQIFLMHYAQGDLEGALQVSMQELEGLDWRSGDLHPKMAFRLIRPGAANIFSGNYQAGVELLERFFAEVDLIKMVDPYDQILIGSALAMGYSKLGRADEAIIRLEQNLDIYNAAIHDGWGDPRLHFAMFITHLGLEQDDDAVEELRLAMDYGWTDYWLISQGPLVETIEGNSQVSALLQELKGNIDSARVQIELADTRASN